jgi:antitoxin ParD1/3/4
MKAETKDTLTEVNISLPHSMKTFIDEVVAEGGYSTASEYVRELIEDAKRRKSQEEQEEIEQRLLESLESGPATPMTKEDWEGIKQRGIERIRQKKAGEK